MFNLKQYSIELLDLKNIGIVAARYYINTEVYERCVPQHPEGHSDFWLLASWLQPMLPRKSGDIPLPVDIEFSLPSVRLIACWVWG